MSGIPWQLILKQAPSLIDAASRLLSLPRPRPEAVAAAKDLNALRDQVAVMAKDQQAQADLLKQVADQLNAIASGAQVAAKRAQWALLAGGVGLLIGVVVLGLVLTR
jgi:hypothetical protein